MTKMDKEMVKQMEQFQRDFPNATAEEKRDFLQYLSLCARFGLTDDDPFGLFNDDIGILDNEYEQAEYIAKRNRKKHYETEADITVRDLLCICAMDKLADKLVEKHTDIPDEHDEEWLDGLIKAHVPPDDTK